MWLRSSNLIVDEFPPNLTSHWGHFTNISLLPSTIEVDTFFCMSSFVWSWSETGCIFVNSTDLFLIGSELCGLSINFVTGRLAEGFFLVNCGGTAGLEIVLLKLTPWVLLKIFTFGTTLIFSDWPIRGTAVRRGAVFFGGCLFWMLCFLFWLPPCSFCMLHFSALGIMLSEHPVGLRPYISAIFDGKVSSSGWMVEGLLRFSLSEVDSKFSASATNAASGGVLVESTVGDGLK